MAKYICCKCNTKIAEWYYMPDSSYYTSENLSYFCDDCVFRGCSCQTDEYGNDLLDADGRLLPCCEYDWCSDGWEIENETN